MPDYRRFSINTHWVDGEDTGLRSRVPGLRTWLFSPCFVHSFTDEGTGLRDEVTCLGAGVSAGAAWPSPPRPPGPSNRGLDGGRSLRVLPPGLPGRSLWGPGPGEALVPRNQWCSFACRGDQAFSGGPPKRLPAAATRPGAYQLLESPRCLWPGQGPPWQGGVLHLTSLCGARL